ncbi:MAG: MFS transporter [Candidatus Pseudobacter hemicellulosilyticus]|uniref:MFS transporter n=1 Tax=Candidatus Pseudobacter hemicellulosilyticus TaxID=3121375 RepID=A0AAJ6BHP1_9BACT|nr:MAG: MFS transporter [Pseudobacter sp.]
MTWTIANPARQVSLFSLLAVTSLGYFVDGYDLIIFSVVRKASIIDLGLASTEEQIKNIGIGLENWQSAGLLLGGIIWGILGDKLGRIKILYGSIAIYSIANFANGFLSPEWGNVYTWYAALRLLSGFGLAGELGAGITLASEAMATNKRGYGSMAIAGIGLLGFVTAAWLGSLNVFKWNTLFIIGGVAGFVLLLFRVGIYESSVYLLQRRASVARGSFFSLFTNRTRFRKFMLCILVGLPMFFVIGLPIKFASNMARAFGIEGVSVPTALITFYLALALGDVLCIYLSQKLKSRKKPLLLFNILNLIIVLAFIFLQPANANQYHYIYCPLLGLSVGYWAMLTTNAAEQFGTNLRATVAVSVPNFVRASFIPIALLFTSIETTLGTIYSAAIVGVACSLVGIISTVFTEETFNKNLDYAE